MRHNQRSRIWSALVVMLIVTPLVLATSLLTAAPAHGAARTSATGSDSLTLSLTNGTSFVYNEYPYPDFHADLVLAQPLSANYSLSVTLTLTDINQTITLGELGPIDTLHYSFDSKVNGAAVTIVTGSHTAVASFTNIDTHVTTQSNPVNFTITRSAATINCSISRSGIMPPGTMLQIHVDMTASPNSGPVDWQDATYAVKFVGPITMTSPQMKLDSSGNMSIPAPTRIGYYNQVFCMFSGTSLFAPTSANIAGQELLISEMHPLSGAQIYTNPATYVVNQTIQMYVVFHGEPGLPPPSGYYGIRLGNHYTKVIQLGSDGTSLIKLEPLSNLGGATQIQIGYQGDPYYNSQVYYFPLTNPPIPGSSSGGSGGNPVPSGSSPITAKKVASKSAATATTAATSSPTAYPRTGAPVVAPTHPSGNGAPIWLVALLGLLVLGGGAGATWYVWRRNTRRPSL